MARWFEIALCAYPVMLLAPMSAAPDAPPGDRLGAGNAYSILPLGAQSQNDQPFQLTLHTTPRCWAAT